MRFWISCALFVWACACLEGTLSHNLYSSRSPELSGLHHYFNADAMYLPALFQDWQAGKDLHGWTLPPAPYLFPDLPIYFTFLKFFPFKSAAFLAGIFLLLFNLFSVLYFAKRGLRVKRSNSSVLLTGAILLCVLARCAIAEEFYSLIVPTFHAGVLGIAFLTFGWMLQSEHSRSRLPHLVATMTLASLSDALIIALVLPAAVSWILVRRTRSSVLAALAIATGLILGRIAVGPMSDYLAPIFRVSPERDVLHFLTSEHALSTIVNDLSQPVYLLPVAFAVVMIAYAMSVKQRQGLILPAVAILSAGVAASAFSHQVGLPRMEPRYALMPLFAAGTLAGMWLFRSRLFFVLAAIFVSVTIFKTRTEAGIHPIEEAANCLSGLSETHGIKKGFADYWHSKQYSVLTDRRVHIEQIHVNAGARIVEPRMWINNLDGYFPENRPEDFDFLIANDLPRDVLLERFGEPVLKRSCGHLDVWIYRKDNRGVVPFTFDSFQLWRNAIGRPARIKDK
ncbi:MAG TPA: hypothetical protein PKN93_10035 [Leptospiraceae bacterium]|nr:hypothetical protein [Leptospiraceae bacterium]